MKIVVITRDGSGLGWALRLKEEDNDVILAISLKEEEKPEDVI